MKQFSGFPAKAAFTPLPNVFFSLLLPEIDEIAELKVTLYIIHIIYGKKGYPRFVTRNELLADKSLMVGLKEEDKTAKEILLNALDSAIKRSTILHLVLTRDSSPEDGVFRKYRNRQRNSGKNQERRAYSRRVEGRGSELPGNC